MRNRVSKVTLLALVTGAAVLVVAACGGSEDGSSPAPDSSAAATPASPVGEQPQPEPEVASVAAAVEPGEAMEGEHGEGEEEGDHESSPEEAHADEGPVPAEPESVEEEHADAETDDDSGEHADGSEPGQPDDDGDPATNDRTVIEVVGGEPVGGVARIRVKNGERAVFTVTSDAAGEVHVHGLDVTKNVGPNADAKFSLKTSFEGIFEIELHGPDGEAEIAKLVIQPN